MGMDQYLLIPFLDFDVNYRGTIGFDTLPYTIIWNILNDGGSWMMMGCALWVFLKRLATWCRHDRPGSWPRGSRVSWAPCRQWGEFLLPGSSGISLHHQRDPTEEGISHRCWQIHHLCLHALWRQWYGWMCSVVLMEKEPPYSPPASGETGN